MKGGERERKGWREKGELRERGRGGERERKGERRGGTKGGEVRGRERRKRGGRRPGEEERKKIRWTLCRDGLASYPGRSLGTRLKMGKMVCMQM